uniref:Uncharacterized protein n=1 Tax=Hordeum vulgare subsp. vulgare TaxID=112509 RepID=A0A8I6WNH7_HORVV
MLQLLVAVSTCTTSSCMQPLQWNFGGAVENGASSGITSAATELHRGSPVLQWIFAGGAGVAKELRRGRLVLQWSFAWAHKFGNEASPGVAAV